MDEVRWLNEQEQQAWITLSTASALLDRVLDQQLRADSGLSQIQYGVLARLSQSPDGELRMLALAEAMAVSKSGLSYQITQLEKQGLVSRRSCESDDRGVVAAITPEGMEKLRHAAPGHVTLVRELVFDALTPQQLKVLADSLAEVQRRIIERGI
ncbi:MarR family winged helix-turn-helix transcriptional regulator [Streptomyces sp. NPDC002328]|uniref:MarR family winged helix-turn-helix transcriptional regulator n=1 Tax=Streptomyces sp. NPDC002328 TaxID=3364642 RepID=UPI0036BC6333